MNATDCEACHETSLLLFVSNKDGPIAMVMISESSTLLTFAAVIAQLNQKYGVRLHISTLHRWRTTGIRGRRLPAWRVGGRWYTRIEDLAAMMEGDDPNPIKPPPAERAAAAQAQLTARFGL